MSELGSARAAARPVIASVIGAIGVRLAIRLRTRQHIVRVGSVSDAVDHRALFTQRRMLEKIAAETCELDRVTVQIGEILSDGRSLGVVPGTLPNAVAGIHGWLIAASLRAEVSVPGVITGAHCGGECLAMRVSARQATEIGAFGNANARDEEGHGMWLAGVPRRRFLRPGQICPDQYNNRINNNDRQAFRHQSLRVAIRARHPRGTSAFRQLMAKQ
jgi:hypothetical protein